MLPYVLFLGPRVVPHRSRFFFFFFGLCQILRFIAKLTLLEHGLVVQSDAVDVITMRVLTKAAAAAAKKGAAADDEVGESTEESETLEEYQHRLETWIKVSLARAGGVEQASRDEYKKSGIVYDKRKKVISEFMKSLTKKRCEGCGA